MSNILESIFIVISTIIGLGVFILPYAYIHSGIYFWISFFILLFAFLILHLAYGELIFYVKEKHNLPGLAEKFLGSHFKKYIWILDFWGTQLVFWAYLIALPSIIGSIIFINPLFLKLIIVFSIILLIAFETNIFARADSFITLLLLLIFIWIIFIFLPKIDLANLEFNFLDPILSYGILIFALTGYSSLQIAYDLIGPDKRKFILINIVSFLLVGLLYALFVIAVAGILGKNVSQEAIFSLSKIIDKKTLLLLVSLAFLNIYTTFVALAFYLKRGLCADFGLTKFKSWLYTSLPILIFVFLDFKNLAKLISAIGSLFIALNLIVILVCYLKLKEKKYFPIPNFVIYLLIVLFVIGFILNFLQEFLL